mmetsp:Transcript_61087/g.147758  ORF Transcript_61087/g.147758 Transcript_61087/m.147758 type:complete len:297 (-) Transcript_61087:150-1040(-)
MRPIQQSFSHFILSKHKPQETHELAGEAVSCAHGLQSAESPSRRSHVGNGTPRYCEELPPSCRLYIGEGTCRYCEEVCRFDRLITLPDTIPGCRQLQAHEHMQHLRSHLRHQRLPCAHLPQALLKGKNNTFIRSCERRPVACQLELRLAAVLESVLKYTQKHPLAAIVGICLPCLSTFRPVDSRGCRLPCASDPHLLGRPACQTEHFCPHQPGTFSSEASIGKVSKPSPQSQPGNHCRSGTQVPHLGPRRMQHVFRYPCVLCTSPCADDQLLVKSVHCAQELRSEPLAHLQPCAQR